MEETTNPLDAEASPVVSYVIPGTAGRHVVHLYGQPFATVERQAHNPYQANSPTGLALWPAGKLVADFLACGREEDSAEDDASSLLELGCGLGLSCLVWHTLHPASRIVLTDCDAETLAYARENCRRNNSSDDCASTLSVENLDWCTGPDAASSLDTFDLVVASDVIYESTAGILPDLLRTAHSHLTPDRGIFILGLGRRTIALEEVRATAVRLGLEGGDFFVSDFLLDIFANRLECPPPPPLVTSNEEEKEPVTATDRDGAEVEKEEEDDEGQSFFWAAAVLVFWRKGDVAAQGLAKDMCRRATQRAEEGWLEDD
jgi:predicted nicotinamide N-methyase